MDKTDLERVIDKAGVGDRTRRKLLRAFEADQASPAEAPEPQTASGTSSRRSGGGHGAPSDSSVPLTAF